MSAKSPKGDHELCRAELALVNEHAEFLRIVNDTLLSLVRDYEQLVDEAAAGWRATIADDAVDEKRRRELEKRLEAWQRSRASLDQKAATAANSQRGKETDSLLRQFVRDRIKQSPVLAAKELAGEALERRLAKKNRAGELLTFEVVLRKVRSLVKQARSDLRTGKL